MIIEHGIVQMVVMMYFLLLIPIIVNLLNMFLIMLYLMVNICNGNPFSVFNN